MPDEEKGVASDGIRWAIAPDWFTQSGRSFPVFLKGYLCPACAKRFSEKKDSSLKNLLAAVQNCCSREPGFFNDRLPILESVFRLFLRNGNTPLTLNQLSSELVKLNAGDVYRTSAETLSHILENERFYGLQPVPANT